MPQENTPPESRAGGPRHGTRCRPRPDLCKPRTPQMSLPSQQNLVTWWLSSPSLGLRQGTVSLFFSFVVVLGSDWGPRAL